MVRTGQVAESVEVDNGKAPRLSRFGLPTAYAATRE